MNCFTLLWMFDSRWLCRFRPLIHEQLLLGPLFVNTSLITALVYDCLHCEIAHPELLALIALLAFLVCLEVSMYLRLVRTRRVVMYPSMSELAGGGSYQH